MSVARSDSGITNTLVRKELSVPLASDGIAAAEETFKQELMRGAMCFGVQRINRVNVRILSVRKPKTNTTTNLA